MSIKNKFSFKNWLIDMTVYVVTVYIFTLLLSIYKLCACFSSAIPPKVYMVVCNEQLLTINIW